DLFNTQIEMCDALTDPNAQLDSRADLKMNGGSITTNGINSYGAYADHLQRPSAACKKSQQCPVMTYAFDVNLLIRRVWTG
ncbi:hypothetical protein O5166_26340, partial [Escherichia coli]|nr:hypothetical protein [Escherichia coli]